MTTILSLIGSDYVGTGASHDVADAATGTVFVTLRGATVDEARRACDAAAAALPAWSARGPNDRRAMLLAAADALARRRDELVSTMAAEIGATPAWAGFNVHLGINVLKEAAALTTQVRGETIPSDRAGCFAMSIRRPAGVVLGIAPWNAPLVLGIRAIATPLACGNTVVLKGSEVCPGTHALIGEIFRDAGFPAGVVNTVLNVPQDAAAVVSALIAHPTVRRVNFTGSTKTGRIIARLCADVLKPVVLELGGKAPLIVFEDADLDEAVAAAAFGAFMNTGQICMSTERLIVHASVADRFVEKLAHKAETLANSVSADGQPVLGPVIDERAAKSIADLVSDAVRQGARCHGDASVHGTQISAHFLTGVTPAMKIYHEESFGPVTTVMTFTDEADAIRLANDTEFGLTAALYTRDISRALRVAEQIDSGMCHINGPTIHDEAQMPFGGVKSSGYGRFGGSAGIAEFTELRWLTIDTKNVHFPI